MVITWASILDTEERGIRLSDVVLWRDFQASVRGVEEC